MHSIVCSIIVSWRQMRSSSSQPSSLPSHNDVHNLRYTNYSTHSHTHTHFNRNYEFHPHFTQRAHNANCNADRTQQNIYTQTHTAGAFVCIRSSKVVAKHCAIFAGKSVLSAIAGEHTREYTREHTPRGPGGSRAITLVERLNEDCGPSVARVRTLARARACAA